MVQGLQRMVRRPDFILTRNLILNYTKTYTLIILYFTGYFSKQFAVDNCGWVGK